MKQICVGFLMSYDYEKLKQSIPPVYEKSDKIYLALDENQNTWKGEFFNVSSAFFDWLKDIDVDNKIEVYKDNFYKPNLTPGQNEARERYLLSVKMGIGNWLIQVDADEFFLNFNQFVTTLRKHDSFLSNPKKTPVQIAGFLINIYKYLEEGILYVDEPTKVMLATNYPNYKHGRNTKERIIYTNNLLLHECLSRTEEELQFKFDNWGHNNQVNAEFFDKWRKANATNYKTLNNLFYLDPKIWKGLGFFPTTTISEIKTIVEKSPQLQPKASFLAKKNFGQWFKHLKPFKKDRTAFESYF